MKNVTTRDTVPCAFVTKKKQRVKQFNKTVYLQNGDEFEIELFNPTTNKVLAQIELNGNSIGAGIVLRPGERVFLERYIDTARKFLFETYEVNGNNPDVRKAIEYNGNVSVKFYGEYISYYANPFYPIYEPIKWGNPIDFGYPFFYHSTGYPPTYNSYTTSCKGTSMGNISSSAIYNVAEMASAPIPIKASISNEPKIETGRIEKGSHSNQSFQYDGTTFNTYWSWISEWKILPLSQKLYTKEDLNSLVCGVCGRLRKNDHKYCPNCGSNNWKIK